MKMTKLTGRQIWENKFVPELHRRFFAEIDAPKKFESMVTGEGGKIYLDHGATRTVEPKVHNFITSLAKAFGLEVSGNYEFPDKHLTAVDLQFKDRDGFKWFSTLIQYKEFSPAVQKAIEEDIARTNNVMSEEGLELLRKLNHFGNLTEEDADEFVHEIIYKFLSRQGKPMKRSTYDLIKKESSEAVNALLIGPDFNHIAYTINELKIENWYGQEVIEVLNERMKHEGFEMLPEIQGEKGGKLRQTSTKADLITFPVEEADGSIGQLESPGKFIELIQRGVERDEKGKPLFGEDKKLKLYRGFIASNTVKLYDSTKIGM